ncbi:MAG: C-terminal binding protein [Nitrososphaeria archaeon]
MYKRFKVVILNLSHPSIDVEKSILGDVAELKTVWCNSPEEVVEASKDADAIMAADIAHVPLTGEILSQLKNVKIISVYGVGTDTVDVKAAKEYGIVIANVPDYGISEVADHTMALALSLIRRVPMLDKALREHGWTKIRGKINYIREKFGEIKRLSTLNFGLIGFGRIAREVAIRAKAFGFKVIAYDPYIPKEIFEKMNVHCSDLNHLLREADIISIHVLLTNETRHMIGEQEFKKMKKSAFIINTSRGAVIDENALVKALKEKTIAGAALDVFEKEPLSKDSPLLKMDNVILTPHIAWYSEEAMVDQKRKTALNVLRVLKGEAPLYPVNI